MKAIILKLDIAMQQEEKNTKGRLKGQYPVILKVRSPLNILT